MTIDELVALSQREFESIHNEMATREELKATEGNILRAIERLGDRLSAYASRWNNEFERLTDNVHNLESRTRARDAPS
jgi:predicted nuclease with TOPRIM domain